MTTQEPTYDFLEKLGLLLKYEYVMFENIHTKKDGTKFNVAITASLIRDTSVEVTVHPSGCNFNTAKTLFDRSHYSMRLPFEDPSIPVKEREPITRKNPRVKRLSPPRAGGTLI
ncbi:MAG: hypothetical protein EXR59_03300 [Dehalococcoidia bacterium]|nr:hypothetical protein [Dehalococcoidia bacterium]